VTTDANTFRSWSRVGQLRQRLPSIDLLPSRSVSAAVVLRSFGTRVSARLVSVRAIGSFCCPRPFFPFALVSLTFAEEPPFVQHGHPVGDQQDGLAEAPERHADASKRPFPVCLVRRCACVGSGSKIPCFAPVGSVGGEKGRGGSDRERSFLWFGYRPGSVLEGNGWILVRDTCSTPSMEGIPLLFLPLPFPVLVPPDAPPHGIDWERRKGRKAR